MLRPFARGFYLKKVVTQNQQCRTVLFRGVMFCVLQRFGFVSDLILRQIGYRTEIEKLKLTTAAWLAQSGERRSAERVAGSNPGRTNTQGL